MTINMKHEMEYYLPKFVRTKHLPLDPNAQRDDLIASTEEFQSVLNEKNVFIEEKLDAANCGMTIIDGQPIIRNRNHILSKSYAGKTPAKMQFASIWNWYYGNASKLIDLEYFLGFKPCVYGEWMYAQHTIKYDQLPDYFIIFDIYNPEEEYFLSPEIYHDAVKEAGLFSVPLLHHGQVTEKLLFELRKGTSAFALSSEKEGIYIKVASDDGKIKNRYKMVRPGFIQGEHWNERGIIKNTLKK
jgi:hypothetical protein